MIFKIQIPLATNEEFPHAFIYNQGRSIEFITPVEHVEECFIDGNYKVYVDATYKKADDKNSQLEFIIHEIVEDEEW